MNLLVAAAFYEGIIQVKELNERHSYFSWAREYCNRVRKPLLRVGMRRGFQEPPNGDLTIDIDPDVLIIPGGVLGDERRMPFSSKQFGVCFNEHTLEHLLSARDVELAVNECVRVADKAVFLCPSPYSIIATFFQPTHDLRLWFDGQKIIVADNPYITGIGSAKGWFYRAPLAQAMVCTSPPIVLPRNFVASSNGVESL